MKKVLVTGATGFIGKACLHALQKQDLEIHAISKNSKIIPAKDSTRTKWHKADLHDYIAIKDLMANVRSDYLLHLAWYVEHGLYWSSEENLKWVDTSLNLATEFANNGGTKLVCAGTCAEYDWTADTCSKPLNEDGSPINPQTLYGACKASLYQALATHTKTQGIKFAWGRLFFPYGPEENPKRLIPSMVLALLQNKPAICNSPELQRDFIFIDDVAQIFVNLINLPFEGAINIGSGQGRRLLDVVRLIANLLNANNLIETNSNMQNNNNDPLFLIADTNKLKNDLSYSPQISLETGLEKTISWWQAKELLKT